MADQPKLNGNNGRLAWWLICTVGTILAGTIAGAFTTVRTSAERIAVLESQQSETRRRLERIEGKIDDLLDNRKHHP